MPTVTPRERCAACLQEVQQATVSDMDAFSQRLNTIVQVRAQTLYSFLLSSFESRFESQHSFPLWLSSRILLPVAV